MSDENTQLALRTQDDLAALLGPSQGKFVDEADLAAAVSNAGGFLPYIQVVTGSSALASSGTFPVGSLVLTQGKKNTDLGRSFLAVILEWRQKAMTFKPSVQAFFDPKSPEFKAIEACADQRGNSGNGFGPELLLWLPDHGTFAGLFFSNKSGRISAPNALAAFNQKKYFAKFKTEIVTNDAKQSWPVIAHETYDGALSMPAPQAMIPVLEKFRNPPASTGKLVEEAESADNRG